MSRHNRERRERNKERRAGQQVSKSAGTKSTNAGYSNTMAIGEGRTGKAKQSDFRVSKPPVPETLFKYEPLTYQSIHNLKSQIVYFGSPKQFNDPYDCAIVAEIDDLSDDEVIRVRDMYLSRPNLPAEARSQMLSEPVEIMHQRLVKSSNDVLTKEREKFLNTRGVTCFSEIKDDLLMWAHYGGKYRGFCLEFHTAYLGQEKWRKVQYVDQEPRISVVPIVVDHDVTQLLDLFCTKSRAWAYEREWRCIHNEVGTPYSYEAKALKAIYFGPEIDRQSLEILCLILKGQNPDVELWQGRRRRGFKVEFERIFGYTSHAEAKGLGISDELLFDRH